MSVVLGESLAHTILSAPAASRTPPTTSAASFASWANMRRGSSRLGQERLISHATTPSHTASASAAARYSSTVLPQMLATTRAPLARRAGRCSDAQAATPGLSRPTALIIEPPATAWTRGGRLPAHGNAESDFTTTAPNAEGSPYAENSVPRPYVPAAVMIGLASRSPPTTTERSPDRVM